MIFDATDLNMMDTACDGLDGLDLWLTEWIRHLLELTTAQPRWWLLR